jgi:hypothetical protein
MRRFILAAVLATVSTNAMAIWPFSSGEEYPYRAPGVQRQGFLESSFPYCTARMNQLLSGKNAPAYRVQAYCSCFVNKLADNLTLTQVREVEDITKRGLKMYEATVSAALQKTTTDAQEACKLNKDSSDFEPIDEWMARRSR